MRTLVLAAVFALALTPALVQGHLPHDRPHIELQEFQRNARVNLDGLQARYDLQLAADPFQDLVRYDIDPHAAGAIRSEFRRQPSEAPTAFVTTWSLGRFIEFRDLNANGIYEPTVDTVIHAWPFASYAWAVEGPTAVNYTSPSSSGAAVPSQDIIWQGTITGGPTLHLETDSAGDLFTDEGARVLPQDMILYLDVGNIPPRGLGDLFAFDGTVNVSNQGSVAFDRIDANTTAGLVARIPDRLAAFDWGAQASLDRVEQTIKVTIGDPAPDGSRAMRLHFPLFDHSLHMVIVVAVEYVNPAKRGTDAVGPGLLLATVALLALSRRR